MVSWSSILTRAGNPVKSFVMLNKTPLLRNSVSLKIPIRNSHGEEMWIRPGRFSWELFKDYAHLYITLGVVPLGALLMYCNIYIGPAKLVPVPEGYRPKHWEYYKHPVTRFLSYICPSEQERYERRLHYMFELGEKEKYDRTVQKVRELQKERQDTMAWYYQPNTQVRYIDAHNEQLKTGKHETIQTMGGVYYG